MKKFNLGISACLTGRDVRYDGGKRLQADLIEALGKHAKFVEICPEYESGLGVPRETMDLFCDCPELRLIGKESQHDYFPLLEGFSKQKLHIVMDNFLCGFVLKSRSPSCGISDAKIYNNMEEQQYYLASGVFASNLLQSFPFLPVASEEDLKDEKQVKNFILRARVMQEWWDFCETTDESCSLIEFHNMQGGRLKKSPALLRNAAEAMAMLSDRLPNNNNWQRYLDILMRCLKA